LEVENDASEASESLRWRRVVDVVVVLRDRERSFGGGAWIFTVFKFEAVKGAMEVVEMLDADVDVEWSELELVEPETEGVVACCGAIICQAGSSSLGFIGKGVGS
jgi:hypothetical protein